MARQPYQSFDPDSGTLHRSTHAPGQGGSSGAAINMLSRGTGAAMALPSRYVSMAQSRSPSFYDRSRPDNRMDLANQAAYEGAMQEQARTQSMERDAINRSRLVEDRGFDRGNLVDDRNFGLESELSRGRLDMQGGLANALAQAMGQRQSFGGDMDSPPWMRPQSGRAQSQYGQGLDLREPTRNYLMRFLKG